MESLIVRRLIYEPNATRQARPVPKYHGLIDTDRYVRSLGEVLRDRPESERFPKDAEFRRVLLNGNVGSLRPCAYLLRRLENYEKEKPLNLDDYEVDHIMPKIRKGGDLPEEWKRALGPDWQEPYERYVNSLGNLTLMKKEEASPRSGAVPRQTRSVSKQRPLAQQRTERTRAGWEMECPGNSGARQNSDGDRPICMAGALDEGADRSATH